MSVYAVELLFEAEPALTKAALAAALAARIPGAAPLDPASAALVFAFPSHPVTYPDGKRVPAQLFLAMGDDRKDRAARLAPAVEQSWRFAGAAEAVRRCGRSVLVSDLMAAGLERPARLALFQSALDAVLDLARPLAIHWQPSQQLLSVEDFRGRARPADGRPDLESGPLNVRYWRVEGSTEGDCLMDTMGLAPFGLPDLQCHFRNLPPREVARVLFNTAAYLFEKGDVVADGHTVEGAEPGSRWKARHGEALARPGRVVLDLDPGAAFAAGSR